MLRFLVVIVLSGIFCLSSSQVVQSAEVKVVDNSIFVETDAYQVQFMDGVITYLSNKLTGEVYTLPLGIGDVPTGVSGRSGLLRRNGASIWTDQATLTEARKVAPLKAEIVFRQGQNEFRLFIGVDARSGDLLIEQEGLPTQQAFMAFSGDAGIWMSEIWTSSFPQKGGKSLMPSIQSFPQVSNILAFGKTAVGKSNSRFFKESRAGFSFGE